MNIKFRNANKYDAVQIVHLLAEGFGWEIDRDISSVFFNASQITCIVAETEGKIIGIATLYILEKINRCIGQIEDVVVSQEHCKKKIGTELITKLLILSKEHQCYKTILNTQEKHIFFYTKLGFRQEQYQMVLRH